MIDTIELDRAVDDCLTKMGHRHAQHIVLVAVESVIAVGTNIRDKDFVCRMLVAALKEVERTREMQDCKGNA